MGELPDRSDFKIPWWVLESLWGVFGVLSEFWAPQVNFRVTPVFWIIFPLSSPPCSVPVPQLQFRISSPTMSEASVRGKPKIQGVKKHQKLPKLRGVTPELLLNLGFRSGHLLELEVRRTPKSWGGNWRGMFLNSRAQIWGWELKILRNLPQIWGIF